MPAQKNRKRLPHSVEPTHRVNLLGGTELARHLMNPQRSRTAVVISYVPWDGPRVDAARLASQLHGDADVYELCNGHETRQLERGLPMNLHVFGTGVRVYPHGPQWPQRTARAQVLRHTSQLPRLYEKVQRAVLAAQRPATAALAAPPVAASQAPAPVDAVVMGFPFEDRAMAEIAPGGTQAMIRGENLLPGIPLHWLLAKGQKVAGTFDPATRFLDIKALLLPHPSPVTVYAHGDVALARVTSVCPTQAFVQLWPGTEFRIDGARISSNDLDSVQDLLTEDEVVVVRVLYTNGAVCLSMLDVDDDEPIVPAPPLVRGGPPWLDLARPYASIRSAGAPVIPPREDIAGEEGESRPSGVVPDHEGARLNPAERRTALQSTQRELERARHAIDELMAAAKKQGADEQVAWALAEQLSKERAGAASLARMLNTAEHQIDALKEELAKTKGALVQLRQQRRSAGSRSDGSHGDGPIGGGAHGGGSSVGGPSVGLAGQALFLDAGEQFRFELCQAWARAVPAVEKAEYPLGTFSISQLFIDSWAGLTGQQRSKTLRAVVDLVADRRGPLRKREPHVLRLNEGAMAGPTLRGEDVCMRLYVEQNTPGALRLHYWKLPSGGVELHEVVSHDVVKA